MLLAMPAMLLANPITEAKAKQQAAQFLAQRMHSGARRAPLKGGTNLTLAGQTKGYYAYNIGRGNGFVMMSASDRTQPILGYADGLGGGILLAHVPITEPHRGGQ